MQRLSRLVKRGSVGQEPLPPAFASWTERGMRIRRASLHLWAGPSASFKTTVLINALLNMKLPTLAFSTDSDESTVASRLIGISHKTPIATAETWLQPTSPHLGQAATLLNELDFIRWDFSPSPSLDDVWNGTYAYATMEGRWPEQIVVDIASDIGHSLSSDEWSGLKALMREAKVLARETKAAVHLVHHVTDGFRPTAERPVPSRADILGKVSALPVLMVNFAPGQDGEVLVACVKNRFAKCDPSGKTFFRLRVDPATGVVSDWTPGVRAPAGGDEDWWQ